MVAALLLCFSECNPRISDKVVLGLSTFRTPIWIQRARIEQQRQCITSKRTSAKRLRVATGYARPVPRREIDMKDENGRILKPCPECGEDEDLSIDSCRSMGLSEVSCDCGHIFQSKCFEENIGKHWNKHVKNYKA